MLSGFMTESSEEQIEFDQDKNAYSITHKKHRFNIGGVASFETLLAPSPIKIQFSDSNSRSGLRI